MIRLRVLPVVAAVAVVALLSGCHGSTGPSGSPTASPSSSSSTSPTPSPTPTPTTAAAPACTRDSLKITYQGTDNSAGHFHGVMTFTNTSAAACTMNGYPIVYMGQEEAEGTQGAASTNDTSVAPALVTVAPGAAAHAAVTITDAGNVCDPVDTTYLVAAPPLTAPFDESTNAEHVYNVDVQACNDPSISLIQVGPVTN
jgi:Protein of unknown function (DUF4232)